MRCHISTGVFVTARARRVGSSATAYVEDMANVVPEQDGMGDADCSP